MKTLQEQYNLIKEGKGHKSVFLKEAKSQFPGMINNAATFDQATHILKKRSVISENYVDLKPINTIEASTKQPWEDKFANYLSEASKPALNPIVNNDMKANTKESEAKIKSEPKLKFEMETNQTGKYKISDGVENIASHNYDYSPKVDNINNVNAQEMMNGVYCEIKNQPSLTLEEAQEKVIKNLSKDSLHYVKEGQFGVAGLGYQQESAGLPNVDSQWSVVKEGVRKALKESLNSFSAKLNEDSFEEARDKAIDASQDKAGMEEEARPDYPDVDGDGDTEEPMAKAAKDKKAKKPKKESIDSRLAEIGKEAEEVKMEAQLDFLHDHIQEKVDRVNSIQEDENLSELIDKKKMKEMQREIKLLEKKKAGMEKIYEKSCGKKYAKKEMVDETEEVDESFDSVVDKIKDSGKSEEDAKKIAGAINAKHVGNYRS
jgi:hypothetical protein|tara:strand:- start:1645 stop:2940 length:1296 start_codon:yes stop_codon:yes gene_type:complete